MDRAGLAYWAWDVYASLLPFRRVSAGVILDSRAFLAADPLIRLVHLVKNYGQHRALRDVSLEIRPGITGLLGPNGAGKSTLIKVLLGLVKVTAGSGTVLGFDIAKDGRQIRTNVGYMPEDDCYIAGMSGIEVVRFSACLSGIPSLEALRRAHEILDFSGVEQERYRDIDTYSTGMRQKIKFAQAIVHDPPLLVLDEPTSALDPDEREAMLARIRTLCTKHGKTAIISTHILPDVRQICDRVIIFAAGEVRLSDSLDVLLRPSAPGVGIRTTCDAARLVEQLRARGHQIQQSDAVNFFVEGLDINDTKHIWELSAETETGLLSLTPVGNSLEQIFMNAVREDQHANS
jgi:ABC-2 type transport system ATP-binding protein